MRPLVLVLVFAASGFAQQTANPRPARYGTTLAPHCNPGDVFFKLDAPDGQQVYGCPRPDQWVLQNGGSGSITSYDTINYWCTAAQSPYPTQPCTTAGSVLHWKGNYVVGGAMLVWTGKFTQISQSKWRYENAPITMNPVGGPNYTTDAMLVVLNGVIALNNNPPVMITLVPMGPPNNDFKPTGPWAFEITPICPGGNPSCTLLWSPSDDVRVLFADSRF